jgi:hypothetical protein
MEEVARCAQSQNSTKCQRNCSEELEVSRKNKLRRVAGENYSIGRIL